MRSIRRSIAILSAFAVLATAALAMAQKAPGEAKDENYNSPMRGQCMDELRKDSAWRASLEKELRVKVHKEEHDLIAKNKLHVFLAYSALWIIVVIFLVLTWLKHRGLKDEVTRLQAEVDRLSAEEES